MYMRLPTKIASPLSLDFIEYVRLTALGGFN